MIWVIMFHILLIGNNTPRSCPTFKTQVVYLKLHLGIMEGQNYSDLSCEIGGVIRVDPYSHAVDSKRSEYYVLNSSTRYINSPIHGNFSAKFIIMETAAVQSYKWIQ
jgi:hypothetical protein